jgi:hypothetical protein
MALILARKRFIYLIEDVSEDQNMVQWILRDILEPCDVQLKSSEKGARTVIFGFLVRFYIMIESVGLINRLLGPEGPLRL